MKLVQRKISKVAVLGSGIMGSRIACLFANIGLEVLLLDIVPDTVDLNATSIQKNKIVQDALNIALKSSPSPIYDKKFIQRIRVGNFEDSMALIADCDWVIEAVIENLEIKKKLYQEVELHRKKGTLISTNTSGISIELLIEGRSEDFKAHFCGTHFFNPPRYLKLFEIIPSSCTNSDIIDFYLQYASRFLGKKTIICKDTPAFIANRIGVYSILAVFHLTDQLNMRIEDVDAITGTLIGKPKSASYRTSDVVGSDTLAKVAKGVELMCLTDEKLDIFKLPDFVQYLLDNKSFGDKTLQGFYKKVKQGGKTDILVWDRESKNYVAPSKTKFESVSAARKEDNLSKRLQILHHQTDAAAIFLKKMHYAIFQYCSLRVPEISDEIVAIDDAMKAGFGWEMGPFEMWDALGVENTLDEMKLMGYTPAPWVIDMRTKGISSFYKLEDNKNKFYSNQTKQYTPIPMTSDVIVLDYLRGNNTVWSNSGCSLIDIGSGILNVEFRTKMNTLGGEIMEGISHALDLGEKGDFAGIVLGNNAPNFSAGANLAMIYMLALEQEYDELNAVVSMFQNLVMRLRYSSIPVVSAPHGLCLGGGTEILMHCDKVIADVESYIGLVEVGVGLIPAGGGTKELALRVSDATKSSDPILPLLADRFIAISTAKVSTSAHEAFDLGLLISSKDSISIDSTRQIDRAKQNAIYMAQNGYTKPIRRNDIRVMGRSGLSGLYSGIEGFYVGNYASQYDKKIAQKVAWVLCGGDLSIPSLVSEQYLLDLEREAFLSLLGEQKTLERIQSILTTGKPLRN